MTTATATTCPRCKRPLIASSEGAFCRHCWELAADIPAQATRTPTEGHQEATSVPQKSTRERVDSALELVHQLLQWAMSQASPLDFCTEYIFHPTRKWRFDVAFPDKMLACEVDGGNRMAIITKTGRAVAVGEHTQAEDYQKMNEAVLLGWRVLRFLPSQVKSGEALAAIEKALTA